MGMTHRQRYSHCGRLYEWDVSNSGILGLCCCEMRVSAGAVKDPAATHSDLPSHVATRDKVGDNYELNCLNTFLLPLRIPFLRCFRPPRSLSLISTFGSSVPRSIPAPNTSTPFRMSFFFREGVFSVSSSPVPEGTKLISIPPSALNRTAEDEPAEDFGGCREASRCPNDASLSFILPADAVV